MAQRESALSVDEREVELEAIDWLAGMTAALIIFVLFVISASL